MTDDKSKSPLALSLGDAEAGKSLNAWRYVFQSASFDNVKSLDCVQSEAANLLFLSILKTLIGSALFNLANSASISASVGGVSELITIPNSSGHVSYFTGSSSWEDSVKISSCRFVNDIVCPQSTDLFLTDKQELYTKFYPNPTDGDMNIFIQNLASKYNICVIDNMGRIVFQDKGINDSFYTLKRNNFTSGIYYVNITFDNSKFDPVISKIMIR